MNPLTNVKNINKLNETELAKGFVNKKSWHDLYKESAWIFIGGLAYGLTEGDILCVFSQYGEIVNINLVRDKKTGKIKGFCFLCYANQKSTILAVDNLNGIKICSRTIRVDHVANYKPPKDNEQDDEITKMLKSEGCAPQLIKAERSTPAEVQKKEHKKHKREKKKHKKRKREDPAEEEFSLAKVKKEKIDEGYSKYEFSKKSEVSSRKNESSENESSESSSESDSTRVSRKKKYESHKHDKNRLNTIEKRGTSDKSWTHTPGSRKDESSSSDSDSHSSRKRKSLFADDHRNDLPSEKRHLKQQRYKGGDNSSNLSSEECSERYKKAHRNSYKEMKVQNPNSRHSRYDSSSESEKDSNLKQSNRTLAKEKETRRRDSVERKKNSYKDRKHQNSHTGYQDHRNRESPHKTDHYRNERRDYSEKYKRFDKDRDSKRDYGKHHFERER